MINQMDVKNRKRKFNQNSSVKNKKRKLNLLGSFKKASFEEPLLSEYSKPKEIRYEKKNHKYKMKIQKGKGNSNESVLPSKKNISNFSKKERKIIRKKKNKEEVFERNKKLKLLWEEFRWDKCKPDRKEQLLREACKLIKGHVKELTYAHDTVRILECLAAVGENTHRELLFEELKDFVIELAKSKYGKYILVKFLRYGTKEQKNHIMMSFHGKIIKLISHTEAAEIVEAAFNECANVHQRAEFVQEFYGPTYRFFKDSQCQSLSVVLAKDTDKKTAIINYMKDVILRLVNKSVIRHSIVHYILHEFMVHADAQSRSEVIESVRQSVAEIVHTKDGSRAAMHCFWHGTTKDRKVIVKSFKTFVAKIAKEEFGHMVLLALFDSVDDTKLVQKYIITELISDFSEISQNLYGRRVLVYLFGHRDPVYFHPDVIKILQQGDTNATSKKDPDVRKAELKNFIVTPFLEFMKSHFEKLYMDNAFCLLVLTFLKHCVESRYEAFIAIAKLFSVPYSNEEKDKHIIESPGSHFMLTKLISEDANSLATKEVSFSEVLVNEVPESVMKSWIHCNRGSFLLLKLLETGIHSVVQRVKQEMTGLKKQLSEKNYKGATFLLKKLKKNNVTTL